MPNLIEIQTASYKWFVDEGLREVIEDFSQHNVIYLELRKKEGIYPAYHMNKKSWITIVLDETVHDDVLFDLLAESHAFTLGKKKAKQR